MKNKKRRNNIKYSKTLIIASLFLVAVMIIRLVQLATFEEIDNTNLKKLANSRTTKTVKLEANRGTVSESGREQLITVAEILLSKNFTIPKRVQFQAADYIITNNDGIIWAEVYTGVADYYGYFGYPSMYSPLEGKDVYGNYGDTIIRVPDAIIKGNGTQLNTTLSPKPSTIDTKVPHNTVYKVYYQYQNKYIDSLLPMTRYLF